jgi:predicted O-linked N-acetylglucosamine transferase (SPINDLY family)
MAANVDQAFIEAQNHHQAGHLAAAEKGYRQILKAFPEHADSVHLLGIIALQTGHVEQALGLVQQAVSLRPDGAVYQSNLGQILERLGRYDEAEHAYRTAISLDDDCAEAMNNLGRLLQGQDRLTEAESLFRKAIESNSAYAEPHANIGNLLKDRGDLDGAIAAFRLAVELRPDLSMLHSNLLLTLHYHTDYSAIDLAREHRQWAERHVSPLASERLPHDNDPDPDRRLRIGYVSADFREHVVARFLLPLLEHHARDAFEIFAYADVLQPDSTTALIRAQCDHWRDVANKNDAELAACVRNDRIDILIDLAAHSGRNRLLVFARKPAPVQITYLAYCSTTGVDAIDYRLTDRFLDPPDTDPAVYSEQSIRLPNCYWCYSAPITAPDQVPPTDRLPGPPTFGCLNNFAKVSDKALELWMRLLKLSPKAHLLIYARGTLHRNRVRRFLRQAGLPESRVTLTGTQSLRDYLATYREIDVALDPFPFTGGTTTCDALWMGVPVVSLAGNTAVSRAGSSLLSNTGLSHLVARSEQDYLNTAAGLLGDAKTLGALRSGLRSRLEASPVMDMPRFVVDLEAALRETWNTWCSKHR